MEQSIQISAPQLLVGREMIALSERKDEFRESLQRGKDNSFDVKRDTEPSAFRVVNKNSGAEHKVKLERRKDQLLGNCSCGDFNYRKRVCKHLSEVLTFTLFAA